MNNDIKDFIKDFKELPNKALCGGAFCYPAMGCYDVDNPCENMEVCRVLAKIFIVADKHEKILSEVAA